MSPGLETAAQKVSDAQLTGLDESHLCPVGDGHYLCPMAATAFAELQHEAAKAGFLLSIASSYRSFARQLIIWNGKLRGQRPVHDDRGNALDLSRLTDAGRIAAVLRFSALPGSSRHHWGTEVDVFDANALAEGESVQLLPSEVCAGGPFDALHCWLDERMARNASCGFFRPYAVDRGGVAPERWHLSFAPLSCHLERRISPELLRWAWESGDIAGRHILEQALPELLERYVSVPPGWAPASAESLAGPATDGG